MSNQAQIADTPAQNAMPARLIGVSAFGLAAFHMYTAGAGQFPDLIQRSLHVSGCLVLTFLIYPLIVDPKSTRSQLSGLWGDMVLCALSLFIGVYVVFRYDEMTTIGYYASDTDILVGGVLVLVLVEAARRVVGWFLPVLAALMLTYALFGYLIPGTFGFAGFSLTRVIEILFTTPRGIYGDVTGISATVIAIFVVFGSVLFACGGGKAFMDIALLIGGRTTGGAAKVAVVASGLFGSLSGSAAANIATTGSFTIPMMTRLGYKPQFASAVEAVASSGGQILPPIMGAGAFVMAELLGISYGSVAVGALLPALLFYGAVFVSTHFESERLGYVRVPAAEIPKLREVLALSRLTPLAVPLVLLIGLMLRGYTPAYAGFWATTSAILLFTLTKLWTTRGDLKSLRPLVDAMILAGRGLVTVGILIACAQIVVSLIAATGIGVKLSALIVSLGDGNLWLSLMLAMCLSIILGMGLPTTAAYLLAATVVAPALSQLGISGLSAHLFIFYFAILAGLTPPVCGAVFIAAALAKTPWTGTLKYTFRLALGAFFVPYLVVEHEALLMGTLGFDPVLRIAQCILLVLGISIALVGNLRGPLLAVERLALMTVSTLLLIPDDRLAAVGALLAISVLGRRFFAPAQPIGHAQPRHSNSGGRSNRPTGASTISKGGNDMNRFITTIGLAVGISALASGTAMAQNWTGYTYLASDTSIGAQNLIELGEEFSEATDGAVNVTVNLAGSLGIQAADITQAVGQGIIEIAADGFFLGAIEEGGILRLPMMFNSIEKFNEGLEIVTPYLEEAFAEKNVVLLGQYVYPLQVSWATFDMTSLEDMQGKRMRVSSPEQGEFVSAFGGAPVTIGGAEVPTALQTGGVDGVFTASVGGGRLWKDQLSSTYRMGPNFFNSAIIVNKDAFDALSPEHQQILRELGAKYAKKATEEQMASEAEVTAELEAGGIAVHEGNPADVDKAIALMSPYWDKWAESKSDRTKKALAETRAALGL